VNQQGFRFHSPLRGKVVFWTCGIVALLVSIGLFLLFIAPRQLKGENLYAPVLVVASLWLLGSVILVCARDIDIRKGELRFRRFFSWKSVPLASVARVQALQAPAVYIKLDHDGKHYRLVFYPGDYEESAPPPVVVFLQDVCRRNHGQV
jgi:hypothetical protein